MKIRFHRSRDFEVILTDPHVSLRRGFFFILALGVEAPVDPLSGMTVNLIQVDRWLDEISWPEEASDVWALLNDFWSVLSTNARSIGARLTRLEIRDRESWWAREESRVVERGFVREQLKPVGGILRPFRREFIFAEADVDSLVLTEFEGKEIPSSGWPASLVEIREGQLGGHDVVNFKKELSEKFRTEGLGK